MGIASTFPGFAAYRELSKSGIVALVLISVLGGYLIGHPSETPLSVARMLWSLFGVLFLAAGSSALNQVQEAYIDAKMPRTSSRPLPSGRISQKGAIQFILFSLSIGLLILAKLSLLVFMLGFAAVIFYNGLYTIWWKKRWSYAAVPGAIPGAIPVLMGYAASTGNILTPGSVYLFSLLFFWQMPHFWVLALRYRDDYEKGGLPTLPVTHGPGVTVLQITIWCLAYLALALQAPFFLNVGVLYLILTIPMSAKVLWELFRFANAPESKRWIRFFIWVNLSLIVYLLSAAADLWSIYLLPYWIR